jgi:hypothetical protein
MAATMIVTTQPTLPVTAPRQQKPAHTTCKHQALFLHAELPTRFGKPAPSSMQPQPGSSCSLQLLLCNHIHVKHSDTLGVQAAKEQLAIKLNSRCHTPHLLALHITQSPEDVALTINLQCKSTVGYACEFIKLQLCTGAVT